MSNAYKEFMCFKWPGIESNAIYNLILLLRLNFFVKETLQVKVNINDAPQELYERVFLGRKDTTGDIYAIKVIPSSSLQQKNQVRRIIAEKDILLQFCNP